MTTTNAVAARGVHRHSRSQPRSNGTTTADIHVVRYQYTSPRMPDTAYAAEIAPAALTMPSWRASEWRRRQPKTINTAAAARNTTKAATPRPSDTVAGDREPL